MAVSPSAQRSLMENNRKEYGDRYPDLQFLSTPAAAAALARRTALLADLNGRVVFGAKGSKLDCQDLSPGCRRCLEGAWSCLFITGNCNCRCFYCPTAQDVGGVPGTNNLDFPRVDDYVDYLERFAFKGASISGGEPLLVLEKSLQYLRAVRRRLGDGVHLWLYTNGTLLTGDIAKRLRDAGLDEIRFDIGATGYSLDPARLAVGVIPHVTVEIPAVPEEATRLQQKLLEMAESGINYLNLHQLRLTPHNYAHLTGRGYTFVHGEKVTVLESELTALELLRFSLDQNLTLPVNYCSFVYKNRFQGAAARRRAALLMAKPFEEVTAAGYLRNLSLRGSVEAVRGQTEAFRAVDPTGNHWQLANGGEQLHFATSLRPWLGDSAKELTVRYAEAKILPAVTYRNPFLEISLNQERKVAVERQGVSAELTINAEEWSRMEQEMATTGDLGGKGCSPVQGEIRRFEELPAGLQDYF